MLKNASFGFQLFSYKSLYLLTLPDGGPYHTETSPLICSANRWTSFYMIGTSVMKDLKNLAGFMIIIEDLRSSLK